MSETRGSNPYISHLIVTQRTTRFQVPQDFQDNQGNQFRRMNPVDVPPCIACEITPYVTETIKGPAKPYEFPLKAYWQGGVDLLESKPSLTEQEQAQLDRLKAYVASTDVIWVEDLMDEAGIEDFMTMWESSFSDVLDIFPEWRQQEGSVVGAPVSILPMQWECRVPFESAKSVQVRLGVYDVQNDVVNYGVQPVQHVLSFEDNATKEARLKRISDMQTKITELTGTIAGLTAEIEALPEGSAKTAKVQEKTRVEADKANWVSQLATIQAVTNGLISQLIALPSIQQSLPAISLAILMKVSEKEGWGLDKATTGAKLVETLTKLAQA